jgi:hypothetical protein
MANFGWAYVNCTDTGSGGGGSGSAEHSGPTGSIQFLTSGSAVSGSDYLRFFTASVQSYSPNTMVLSGNLIVTGALTASVFHYENITEIDATGSTSFGDTDDDTHMRTGSLVVENEAATVIFSASATTEVTNVRGFNVLYEIVESTDNPVAVYTASSPSYIIGVQSTGSVEIEIPDPGLLGYDSGSLILVKDEVGHLNGTDIRLSASSAGTYTIDGGEFYTLTGSNPAISLYSNGANWFVF